MRRLEQACKTMETLEFIVAHRKSYTILVLHYMALTAILEDTVQPVPEAASDPGPAQPLVSRAPTQA
jgi:hypothetical protein